ncbi:MAG: segregation/condensation protein A [Planctomycetes bacterium]|nr:segregation/condensation protein A [Planctomycetota bacterium]
MAEPRVSTSVYTGPLDLLLYLCRRAEVDIYDLPVAEIAEQYIKELEAMQTLDLEYAGEFLSMAASLLKLKSDLVLARSTQNKEAEEERSKLVKQLLEYKRLRDLAFLLGERWNAQAARHGRPQGLLTPAEINSDNDTYLEDAKLSDIYRAYFRIAGEISEHRAHVVDLGGRTVRDYIELILAQLKKTGRVNFTELVGPGREKGEKIGNFLALLELVKQHEVELVQENEGGDILVVKPAPPEPGAG